MNVGFISDLHIDNFTYTPEDYIDTAVEVIKNNSLDMFVIGGDISNSFDLTTSFVETLQKKAHIPVYFIPGNHDLWDRETEMSLINTMEIYNKYKAHPQCLIESPVMLTDKVGLVGHTAWYNYVKYNFEKFSQEQISKGKYKGVTWQDKKYIKWPKDDREMSSYFADIIDKDFQKLNAQEYILVTHIVTTPEFTMPIPHRVFDFFNAYIATDDLNYLYDKYKIKESIMGHVHFRSTIHKQNTRFTTNSLCYVKEWRVKDMYHEMNHALSITVL